MNNVTEKVERFEVAYNQIHDELEKLSTNKDAHGFVDLLYDTKHRYASIRHYFEDLKSYARLRNALVHEKTKRDYYIADPHEEVVTRIEEIAAFLQSPPNATQLASSPVKLYDTDELVTDVLTDMLQHSFSQFPVYQDGKFSFLMTERAIVNYVAEQLTDQSVHFRDEKVTVLKKYEPQSVVKFVSDKVNVIDIETIFEDKQKKKQKLEAIIVTENGKKSEAPLGIITSWDLLKLED